MLNIQAQEIPSRSRRAHRRAAGQVRCNLSRETSARPFPTPVKQTAPVLRRRATRGMGVWCWNSPRKLRQMCIVCATWSAVQGLALSSVSKAVRLIKKYPKKYLLRSPISTSSTRPRPHCTSLPSARVPRPRKHTRVSCRVSRVASSARAC